MQKNANQGSLFRSKMLFIKIKRDTLEQDISFFEFKRGIDDFKYPSGIIYPIQI